MNMSIMITEARDKSINHAKINLVVLVHGFNGCSGEMAILKNQLEFHDYRTLSVDLPTTFQGVQTCTDILAQKIDEYLDRRCLHYNNIQLHFIGHSMGGLIIKNFWSQNQTYDPGRNVLIATPHQGTYLVDLLCKIPLFSKVFKPLLDLKTPGVNLSMPSTMGNLDFGVIAGTKGNILTNRLLPVPNDGRVAVSSTKFEFMTDMVELYFGHKKIHRTQIAAKLAIGFIKSGSFR